MGRVIRCRGTQKAVGGFVTGAIERLECRVLLSVGVSIDTTQHFQTIEGFGTSVGTAPALYESAAFQKMYYADLGSSMLRLPVRLDTLMGPGGTLASPVTLGPDLQSDIALFNFNQSDVQSDGILAATSKTYQIDSVKIIGSIWSPPNWMKGPELNWQTGQPDGILPSISWNYTDTIGGSLIDTPANLAQFGLFVAAYVKGFQETFGVPFYAISIQNELAFFEPYSSCVYTPQIFVDAIKAVHDAFVQYGITTKIIGPEDVGVGQTYNPWQAWRQMQYINAVRADPQAMADLSAYAIHGLADDSSMPGRSPTMWDQYVNGRSPTDYPAPYAAWWTGISNDGKESWQTEMLPTDQSAAGALLLAENAQDALVQGDVSAWLDWQTADGGPASVHTLTSGTDETTLKFGAAQQFFRYIRPGSYRVGATPSDPAGVYVSAFVQDQQHTLTTVLINAGSTDQTVNLSVGDNQVSVFNIDRRTDATDVFADEGAVPVVNGVATITLPAGSIVTLQGSLFSGLSDGGFELPQVGAATYAAFAFDPAGDGWTFQGRAGVTGNGSGFTALNPNAPEGSQVAFLQMADSSISQTVSLAAGTYTVSFSAAQRVQWQTGRQDFAVSVDGVSVGTFTPPSDGIYNAYTTGAITLATGAHTITFTGLDTMGGDNTAFIDNVRLAAAPAAIAQPANAGFESPAIGAGGAAYVVDPANAGWTFSGTAGLSGNASAFTGANPNAPQGAQVGYLQMAGSSISQTVSLAAGTYAVQFMAAQRILWQSGLQDFEVLIDGQALGQFEPPAGGAYSTYQSAPITLATGTHTIEFLGLDTAGGDHTAFIDAVQIVPAVATTAPVADSGFENPSVGSNAYGAFALDPMGSAWQFNGNAYISGNGSGFTAWNPAAPEGGQVGVLQMAGSSISQTVSLATGTYAVDFLAAQRILWQSGRQDFEVLIDGAVVGTFTPTDGNYRLYQSNPFTVTAGDHLLQFVGLDSMGGDNSAFIDSVQIGLAG
jgi:O-glycosyl hydrolase